MSTEGKLALVLHAKSQQLTLAPEATALVELLERFTLQLRNLVLGGGEGGGDDFAMLGHARCIF